MGIGWLFVVVGCGEGTEAHGKRKKGKQGLFFFLGGGGGGGGGGGDFCFFTVMDPNYSVAYLN